MVDCLLHLLGSYQYEDSEELVLNCVCALTNLSFYHGHPDNKVGGVHVCWGGGEACAHKPVLLPWPSRKQGVRSVAEGRVG